MPAAGVGTEMPLIPVTVSDRLPDDPDTSPESAGNAAVGRVESTEPVPERICDVVPPGVASAPMDAGVSVVQAAGPEAPQPQTCPEDPPDHTELSQETTPPLYRSAPLAHAGIVLFKMAPTVAVRVTGAVPLKFTPEAVASPVRENSLDVVNEAALPVVLFARVAAEASTIWREELVPTMVAEAGTDALLTFATVGPG